ncbi:MAG: RNA polymerase sigma-70 factor [Lutibacter sp.]|jgi:RNA polymerase sigma-70 factor (ECF subfamily)|nr:RNA polymerase sigma-70 factor [Lutibacter sp.]
MHRDKYDFTDESTLISQLKKGNEDALNHVYKLYYSQLYNYTKTLCGNDDLAKDIVQETMIKIWRKSSTLNIQSSLRGYLLKSIYYHFIDTQRRIIKETNQLNFLKQEALLEFSEISSEDLENLYLAIDVEIDSLPTQCKEVFLLGKKEGLKYKEIADKLNISIKTVERHMSIALKKLRKKLNNSSYSLFLLLSFRSAKSIKN